MHKTRSPRRKRFGLYAILTSTIAGLAGIGALLLGVTPAMAASLAQDPDTQILVFLIPLTLLIAAMLVEVARIVLRGALPAEAPLRRTPRRPWSATRGGRADA